MLSRCNRGFRRTGHANDSAQNDSAGQSDCLCPAHRQKRELLMRVIVYRPTGRLLPRTELTRIDQRRETQS